MACATRARRWRQNRAAPVSVCLSSCYVSETGPPRRWPDRHRLFCRDGADFRSRSDSRLGSARINSLCVALPVCSVSAINPSSVASRTTSSRGVPSEISGRPNRFRKAWLTNSHAQARIDHEQTILHRTKNCLRCRIRVLAICSIELLLVAQKCFLSARPMRWGSGLPSTKNVPWSLAAPDLGDELFHLPPWCDPFAPRDQAQ